jgi:hypothetical protein
MRREPSSEVDFVAWGRTARQALAEIGGCDEPSNSHIDVEKRARCCRLESHWNSGKSADAVDGARGNATRAAELHISTRALIGQRPLQ